MNTLQILVVLGAAYAALSADVQQDTNAVGSSLPPHPPITTTATPPTKSTTTTTTSTTPRTKSTTTTTTTIAPPTNSTTTTTTTATPPTTSTTTTTTTIAPPPNTTTATPPTTTTPSPITTTVAPDSPIIWFVNITGTNRTCIIAKLGAQIEVNKTKIDIPKKAITATGNCGDNKQQIILTWNATNNITFNFAKGNNSKFDLERIDVVLNYTLPGYNVTLWKFNHSKHEFATPVKQSYFCHEQKLDLSSVDKLNVTAFLHLTDLQIEAFHNTSGTKFGDALNCVNSGTPDVVPIAVGCALAALVIIILVAYLVGRRRSQARGYTSM